MSTEKKGLSQKYKVLKADGSEPQGSHCYFVLDIISDDPAHREACREALITYAILIAPTNPALALDLRDLLRGAINA